MKRSLVLISAALLACSGCVAGPGGANNAANRTITGAAAGALLGGLAGSVVGIDAFGGAAAGAIVGGAAGAAVNPNQVFRRDTRGYCYTIDAEGRVVYDYSRRC